ncbi:MAG: hypothetical protein RIR52_1370, partial [Acidobacteriota bacterium]
MRRLSCSAIHVPEDREGRSGQVARGRRQLPESQIVKFQQLVGILITIRRERVGRRSL